MVKAEVANVVTDDEGDVEEFKPLIPDDAFEEGGIFHGVEIPDDFTNGCPDNILKLIYGCDFDCNILKPRHHHRLLCYLNGKKQGYINCKCHPKLKTIV